MVVVIRGWLVSAAGFGPDDHGKVFGDTREIQNMIDLVALGHAGNSQIVVSGAILDEGDDARRNRKGILAKLTMQRMFTSDQFAHSLIVNRLVGAVIRSTDKRDVIHAERLEIILVFKLNSLVC